MTSERPTVRTWVVHLARAVLIAAVAGVLAFGGSFALEPTYTASTRVLVRARDATLLSGSGERVGNQAGVFDATLARQLVDTEAALLSSQTLAERVVDELKLDTSRPARGAVGTSIRAVMGFLAHGFYKEPSDRDAAINEVRAGLAANPVKDSYVLEIDASAGTAKRSAAIANSAANALVDISRDRSRGDAAARVDVLQREVREAGQRQADATKALADARAAAGVSSTGVPSRPLTADVDNQLKELDAAQGVATATVRGVQGDLNAALANSQDQRVELTRLDDAKAPTYPVKPLRILYLIMGGFCGLVVAGAISYRSLSRAGMLSTWTDGSTTGPSRGMPGEELRASNGNAKTPAMVMAAVGAGPPSAAASHTAPPKRVARREAAPSVSDLGDGDADARPAKRSPRRATPATPARPRRTTPPEAAPDA